MQKHNLTLSVNIEGMNLTPYLFLSYEIQQASAGKALAVFLGYFYATHIFQFDRSRSVLI